MLIGLAIFVLYLACFSVLSVVEINRAEEIPSDIPCMW